MMDWLRDRSPEDRWGPVESILVSDILPSHEVEAGRRLNPRYVDDAILVIDEGRKYRIHDGNARLERARESGRLHIDARVRLD